MSIILWTCEVARHNRKRSNTDPLTQLNFFVIRSECISLPRNMNARLVFAIHDALWLGDSESEDSWLRRFVESMMTAAGYLRTPRKLAISKAVLNESNRVDINTVEESC